jgi:hypothetical protein
MFECHCMNPPFYHLDFESISLGEDVTDKVNSSEVTIETCKSCGSKWIRYFFEHPLFGHSGTWYRGLITEEMASSVRAENAIALVESLEWYFRGGSFYKSQGERCSGKIGSK